MEQVELETATLLGSFSAEIKFARGPQMSKGLIFFAEGFKNQAQVIMGVREIGISIERVLIAARGILRSF